MALINIRNRNFTHQTPFWFSVVASKIRDVGCEALVEPQIIPPPHGYQVSKPLTDTLSVYWQHISKDNRVLIKVMSSEVLVIRCDTICASSCEMTDTTHFLSLTDEAAGLYKRAGSLYMIRPQFSMAPAPKSGTAIWSKIRIKNVQVFHCLTEDIFTLRLV